MVEGDAENLLVPVIAEIIGYPLERHGVSIVNVGSTAFLRYSRIFIRKDGESMGLPVAVITDCDIEAEYNEQDEFESRKDEMAAAVVEKEGRYTEDTVKAFISPQWTLEYCVAQSCLRDDFHKAVHYGKKIKNSNKYALTDEKIADADKDVFDESNLWKDLSCEERAYKIYNLMRDSQGKSGLKAIVAQCLASILNWKMADISDEVPQSQMFELEFYQFKIDKDKKQKLKEEIEKDPYLKYIVDAVKYAVGVN